MSFQNKQCKSCRSYHGKKYGNNFLVCGIHPTGQENCPDYQGRIRLNPPKKYLKIYSTLVKLFSFTYLFSFLLPIIAVFGTMYLSKSLYESFLQKIPMIEDLFSLFTFCLSVAALGIMYLEYQLAKKYIYQVSKKISQNIVEDLVIVDWLKTNYLTERLEELLEDVSRLGMILGFLTILGTHKMLYFLN